MEIALTQSLTPARPRVGSRASLWTSTSSAASNEKPPRRFSWHHPQKAARELPLYLLLGAAQARPSASTCASASRVPGLAWLGPPGVLLAGLGDEPRCLCPPSPRPPHGSITTAALVLAES